jgi:hypothetical protein
MVLRYEKARASQRGQGRTITRSVIEPILAPIGHRTAESFFRPQSRAVLARAPELLVRAGDGQTLTAGRCGSAINS